MKAKPLQLGKLQRNGLEIRIFRGGQLTFCVCSANIYISGTAWKC